MHSGEENNMHVQTLVMVGRLNGDFSYCLCFCFTRSFASLCDLAKLWGALLIANRALIVHAATNLPESFLLPGKVHVWQITLTVDVLPFYVWRQRAQHQGPLIAIP